MTDEGTIAMELDAFGFILGVQDPNACVGEVFEGVSRLNRREKKWIEMTTQWDKWMRTKLSKVKSRCIKGIPESMRGRAWQCLCASRQHPSRIKNLNLFASLVAVEYHDGDPAAPFMRIIGNDLYRTFPHHYLFREATGVGQANLAQVLRAYVGFNPAVGYCQGMGYVAGVLVMYMLPEDAFWCFVRLLGEVDFQSFSSWS